METFFSLVGNVFLMKIGDHRFESQLMSYIGKIKMEWTFGNDQIGNFSGTSLKTSLWDLNTNRRVSRLFWFIYNKTFVG